MNRIIIALTMLLTSLPLLAEETEVRITHFDERDGFTESYITGVIQDREGFIWVSSWNGLSRYDGYRFVTFKARPGDGCPLETNRINGIKELANHNILCKSNNRYYIFCPKTQKFSLPKQMDRSWQVRPYHTPEAVRNRIKSLPEYAHIEVKFLCTDRQGGIWLQSNRGLERVWFVKKAALPEKYGSEGEEPVRGAYRDSKGRIWIADKNGVVRIYNRFNTNVPFLRQTPLFLTPTGQLSTRHAVFGSNVYVFYEDKQGTMWLGTKPHGLFSLQTSGSGYKLTHYVHNANDRWSLSDDNIYDIKESIYGDLLIATFKGGLNIIKPQHDGKPRFVNPHNLLRQSPQNAMQCRSILTTSDGTVLVGTTNGLVSFRPGPNASAIRFTVNRRNPQKAWSLSSNYIMGMLLTRSGKVLIATSGGGVDCTDSRHLLSNDMHFSHFSYDDGLSSDMTQALQEDPSGRVWIISEASLSCIDIKRHRSVNYLKRYFRGHFAFTEMPPLCLPNGLIIIGTTQGTLTVNTLQMDKSRYVPKIIFNCDSIITMQGGSKNLDLAFAALDYNKNEVIVYAYKLEGIDKKWHFTTSHELHYVGLMPGTYKLRVRSTNGDGVWVDNERDITIHRKATFIETPYFWLTLGMVVALLIYGVTKVVLYVRRLQNEIKDIKLTSEEKIAVLGNRIRELLDIGESLQKADTETPNSKLPADDQQFAEKLKAYVTENLSNSELQVIDMAAALSVSRTMLFAKVRRIFNCSPNNYLLNMRVNKAKEMLSQSNRLVADVAYRCGFSDPKYFSRCFKKLTGKRPTEWRG